MKEKMKILLSLLMVVTVFVSGCEKEMVSQDAVALSIDFTWQGMQPCSWGNPEIRVSGVPEKTKILKISMYDHAYRHDHGTVLTPYTGRGVIAKDKFKKIQGPCPPGAPGRYEITVKALDDKEVVIGIGSQERIFPEKE